MTAEFLAQETARCMQAMMETGEFPADICPADLYTYAQEFMQEQGIEPKEEPEAKA